MNSIVINNKKIALDFFLNSENVKKNLTDEELYARKFIKLWLSGADFFEFHTSGSTGSPKKILHSRKKLEYSAKSTLAHLEINDGGSMLLPLSPKFIGGAMVIVRAMVGNHNLSIIRPDHEFKNIKDHFALTSFVPLQIRKIVQQNPRLLEHFDHILIGGAPLDRETEQKLLELHPKSAIFATFGMTETASHIALRPIGEEAFTVLGDIRVKKDQRGCLAIRGTVTDHEWIHTNDLVEIHSSNRFLWKGRADLVINSAGFKINPEKVESVMRTFFPDKNIIVTGKANQDFGEKVICLIEGKEEKIPENFPLLHPYEVPKEYFFIPEFIYTHSGKIDRIKTKKLLL